MSERREGFYWVKRARDLEWVVAEWLPSISDWYECGNDEDIDVLEVGHRIPTPDEGWQCVPKRATESMLIAEPKRCHVACQEHMEDIYSAMLSAAPKPEDV